MGMFDNWYASRKSGSTEVDFGYRTEFRDGEKPPTLVFVGLAKKIEDFERL